MDNTLSKVKATLEKYRMVSPGERILIACSGGADSVALFYLLRELAPLLKIRLNLAHFDHRLRPDSAKDYRFVERLARRFGVPFCGGRRSKGKGSWKNFSPEEKARRLRYDFLEKAARRHRIRKVALGHHRDDQAETVLMRILQGTGLRGLQGIRPVARRDRLTFIRPLIELSRREIRGFLRVPDKSYRDDNRRLREGLRPLRAVGPGGSIGPRRPAASPSFGKFLRHAERSEASRKTKILRPSGPQNDGVETLHELNERGTRSGFISHPEARRAEGSQREMLRFAQHDRTYETSSRRRPFSDRKVLLGALEKRPISFREDTTNQSPQFLRNRIRHRLLPLLEKEFNPQIRDLLCRLAETAADEFAGLDEWVRENWVSSLKRRRNGTVWLDRDQVLSLPAALQFRLVDRILRSLDPESGLGFESWERMREGFRRGSYRATLPKNLDLTLTKRRLSIGKGASLRGLG